MNLYHGLRCLRCNELHPKATRFSRCPSCSGLLDPEYDLIGAFDWEGCDFRDRDSLLPRQLRGR